MTAPMIPPGDSCQLCDPWSPHDDQHVECLLRDAIGGVGHVLDHSLWCVVEGDPDAGLSKRESALCVSVLIDTFGTSAVCAADIPPVPLDLVCLLAGVAPPSERTMF